MRSGNLKFLEPSGPLQACNGTDFAFMPIVDMHKELLKGQTINLNLKMGFPGETLNKEAELTFEMLSTNQEGVASRA